MEILLAFITGLTTGGLSCLAVQGGLLASSIAHEVEQSVQGQTASHQSRKQGAKQPPPSRAARPILLFLSAKVVAYTILGFFLGLLGSVLQLTATMRAVMLFAIGIFMLGNALRMLNVHPIFRYFALEPPAAVTRYIRRKAKGRADDVTPLFLGALTVLIPCGVTQAMMAVAIGTGNPITGAMIMFAFTLGASPVFFAVAYFATRMGERLEANFMRVVAVLMLVLGLVSIESGLTLMGSPYSITNIARSISSSRDAQAAAPIEPVAGPVNPQSTAPDQPAAAARPGQSVAPIQTLEPGALGGASNPQASTANVAVIAVGSNGYRPNLVHAKPGQPLQLAMKTNNTYNCARAFVIPALRIEKVLPPTGTVMIDVPAQQAGSKLFFSCSMGMYSGVIVFDG
jgi:sulfite exporter TauE/SafE